MTIDCSKCPDRGSCCGPIPFKEDFIEKHKDKIQIKISKKFQDKLGIYLLTEDMGCVFLNRKTRKCMIYEERPEICKAYGEVDNIRIMCPYFKKNGNPRSEAQRKKIMRWHNHNVNDLSRGKDMDIRIIKQNQNEP